MSRARQALDATIAVQGLACCHVAKLAGVDGGMSPESRTYVHDSRAAFAETFAWLRGLADSARKRDLADRFVEPERALELVRRLVTKPPARKSALLRDSQGASVAARLGSGPTPDRVSPLSLLTWNVSQKLNPKSAQSPADDSQWSALDNLVAVQHDVRRQSPDLVALQECDGPAPLDVLLQDYVFVGARQGHAAEAGHVHLYARAQLWNPSSANPRSRRICPASAAACLCAA